MVVDAIIRYWVEVVAPTEDRTERLGLSIQYLAAYFYTDDGLVVSTQPERLKREFDVFVGLFYRVGLRTNARKMVSMAFQPFLAPGQMSSEAYERRATGTRTTFWEQQNQMVPCPECRVEVAVGLILTHRQSQNGVGRVASERVKIWESH